MPGVPCASATRYVRVANSPSEDCRDGFLTSKAKAKLPQYTKLAAQTIVSN